MDYSRIGVQGVYYGEERTLLERITKKAIRRNEKIRRISRRSNRDISNNRQHERNRELDKKEHQKEHTQTINDQTHLQTYRTGRTPLVEPSNKKQLNKTIRLQTPNHD